MTYAVVDITVMMVAGMLCIPPVLRRNLKLPVASFKVKAASLNPSHHHHHHHYHHHPSSIRRLAPLRIHLIPLRLPHLFNHSRCRHQYLGWQPHLHHQHQLPRHAKPTSSRVCLRSMNGLVAASSILSRATLQRLVHHPLPTGPIHMPHPHH